MAVEKKQNMAMLNKVLGRESDDSHKFNESKAANVAIARAERKRSLTPATARGGGDDDPSGMSGKKGKGGSGDVKARGLKRKSAQRSAGAKKGGAKRQKK